MLKKEKIYHAAKLFDVGAMKMEKLYSHFGSLSNMANTKSNSVKIEGIGSKTMKKVKAGLNSNILQNT